jgi:hypothetical protein
MFRVIAPDRQSRVTNAELFFDLVFVFAVTQLSHMLLGRFTALGAVQVTLLFLAVWWVWVYTAWITNWLDPDVVDLFPQGRGSGLRDDLEIAGVGAGGGARLYLSAYADRDRDHPHRRGG